MDEELRLLVRTRAQFRCEYCRLPEEDSPVIPHHIEHIIPRKHGGPTKPSNLALSCHRCNFHKATNLAGLDPHTRKLTRLFNPRRHKWARHFRWDNYLLVGKTDVGRTTVEVLAMNNEDRIQLRQILEEIGRFPW